MSLRTTLVLEYVAFVSLSAWVAWACYALMSVGLVTWFVGVLGIGAAFAGVVNLTARADHPALLDRGRGAAWRWAGGRAGCPGPGTRAGR